jgi:6-phosphogluconolactonase
MFVRKVINLLIGTYTQKCENKGILHYDFNTNTGDFSFKILPKMW